MLCCSCQVAKLGELAASAKTGQSTLYNCLDLGKLRKKVEIVAGTPCVLEPEFWLTSPNRLPGHASCLWQVGPWLCGSSQPLQTLLDRVQALAGQAEQTGGGKDFVLKWHHHLATEAGRMEPGLFATSPAEGGATARADHVVAPEGLLPALMAPWARSDLDLNSPRAEILF